MMALTIDHRIVARTAGIGVIVGGSITFDSSYPTGGEAVTAANLGITAIGWMFMLPAAGYVPVFDSANSKILVYQGDNDAVADGPGVQVPNTTDLSALTVTFLAFPTL